MYDICTQNFTWSSNVLVINIKLKAKYRFHIDHAKSVFTYVTVLSFYTKKIHNKSCVILNNLLPHRIPGLYKFS
jgi:hypothetical protein